MAETAQKYQTRAPRYILKEGDDDSLRFVTEGKSRHNSHQTYFLNISHTGIAFVTSKLIVPKVGELIKLEFTIPGGDRIAWWAEVVRTQEYKIDRLWKKNDSSYSAKVLVGARFHELPARHRDTIKESINHKLKLKAQAQRQIKLERSWYWLTEHFWQAVVYVAFTGFVLYLLYLLAQPTQNYDPDRGSPWGQRFKKIMPDRSN